MNKILFTLLAAITVFSCGTKIDNSFTFSGSIPGAPDGFPVFLVYQMDDSTVVDRVQLEGEKFEFIGFADEPISAVVALVRDADYEFDDIWGIQEKTDVFIVPGKMELITPDSLQNGLITGSYVQDELYRWRDQIAELNAQREELNEKAMVVFNENGFDSPELQEFMSRFRELDAQEREMSLEYIIANPGSYFALKKLYPGYIRSVPVETADSILQLFNPEIRNTKAARVHTERFERIYATAIGKPAPDFTQPDPDGNPISLSDFRGKYILVDFWASWCGPCRKENPHVLKAYDNYKDKNFEILGVSLDRPGDRDKWLKAVEDDRLTWPQVSDLQGWSNAASSLYAVSGIPSNFLISPEGVILEKNLRGDRMEEILAKYLD